MSSRGYILIARGLLDDPRFKPRGPYSDFEAWFWLIEFAAHTVHDVAVSNGRHREIVRLEPGQMTHSIRFLAKAWGWPNKRVQRFLRVLRSDLSVTTQTTTGQTLITLCNYEKYQRPFAETTTQSDTQTTTQTTTKKKELKEKKDNAPSDQAFDEWYSVYPRKKQRLAAKRAFDKIIAGGRVDLATLIEKTKAFAAGWTSRPESDRKFIPYPASWLNSGGYDDEPDVPGQASIAPPARDPKSFTDDDWAKRLDHHRSGKPWMPDLWGAAPGEPGCLVPAHLLLKPVRSSEDDFVGAASR